MRRTSRSPKRLQKRKGRPVINIQPTKAARFGIEILSNTGIPSNLMPAPAGSRSSAPSIVNNVAWPTGRARYNHSVTRGHESSANVAIQLGVIDEFAYWTTLIDRP